MYAQGFLLKCRFTCEKAARPQLRQANCMLLSAKYIFPVTSSPVSGGALLVRDDKIADIGDFESLKLRYPDEEVMDFGMAALLPGFVDLHTKLEMSAMRGIVADLPYAQWLLSILERSSELEPSDWYDSAILGGLDALASGITTVADITSTGSSLKAVKKLGLRGVIYREVGAMDKMRVNYAMHSAESDIYKWRQDADPARITVGIAPSSIYANHPQVFQRVSHLATKEDMPLALRLAGTREEYNFVKYGSSMFAVDTMDAEARGYVEIPPWLPFGVTPVRYALNWGAFDAPNVMVVYAVHVEDEDINKMREHGVSICMCPRANARLGMGMAPLSEYLKSGFRMGLGTDSPAATDSTDMFSEMRVGLLMNRARDTRTFLDSATMLELATIGGAKALKMDDRIGSLEIGKQADILAVDLSGTNQSIELNPVSALVNSCMTSDVLMTMVAGNILYEKNRWHVDVEAARNIARVIEIRAKLKS